MEKNGFAYTVETFIDLCGGDLADWRKIDAISNLIFAKPKKISMGDYESNIFGQMLDCLGVAQKDSD